MKDKTYPGFPKWFVINRQEFDSIELISASSLISYGEIMFFKDVNGKSWIMTSEMLDRFIKKIFLLFLGNIFILNGCSRSYDSMLSPIELKEDLHFVLETAEQVHPNLFAYTSKEEFAFQCNKVKQQIKKPLSKLDFYKSISSLVASLKFGHTFVRPPNMYFQQYIFYGGKVYPLTFLCTGNKVILEGYEGSSELPVGGEIITIDDQNAKEFLIEIGRFYPSEGKAYNLAFLQREGNLPMFLWLAKGKEESLRLKIRGINGLEKDYVVAPEKCSWPKIVRGHKRTSSKNYTYHTLTEYNAGLIEFNLFLDLEGFKIFLKRTFEKIQASKPSALIIDIRNNPGGNTRLGDELLKYLTDKPFSQFELAQVKLSPQLYNKNSYYQNEYGDNKIGSVVTVELYPMHPADNPLKYSGPIYLLIGPKTASSAMSFAAAIKELKIGTLIGEETTDTPVNYGAYLSFKLPNSKLNLCVASKRIVCIGGKENGRGVLPHYEITQKPEDIIENVDTVLQFTLDFAKRACKPL